jgi:poly-beta-1,6-N-acetyl-D-glucosamine synthase
MYWAYEKFIRAMESRVHSMLGATGAIYAIRKPFFTSLPGDMVLDDMFVPLNIIRRGYRAIFDDAAKAYDQAAREPQEEYRRKVRTLFGNYQIFTAMPYMFNPLTSPIAIQLFSHKFLRLIVPFLMIALVGVNFFLLSSRFFEAVLFMQLIFYSLAGLEWLAKKKKYAIFKYLLKAGYVPYIFCLLNFAALAGFWRFVSGRQRVTWEKARAVSTPRA